MTNIQTPVFFDLTREGWLPCLDREGKPLKQLLSLREIFAQAHELADINGDSPLVDAALYRLLLVILHRNFQNTQTRRWQELWDEQKFDMQVLTAYFDEWQDQKERFFLYHPTHPFYQSPKAYGGGEHGKIFDKSVGDLIREIALGNDATLFSHNIHHGEMDDGNITIELPNVVRMLITSQAYRLPGRGAYKDDGVAWSFAPGPLVDGILFIAKGKTLFETLMLNLIEIGKEQPFIHQNSDRPCWERDDPFERRVVPSTPDGYMDYLTWQTTRILLDRPVLTHKGNALRKMKMSVWVTGTSTVGGKRKESVGLSPDALKKDPMKAFNADSEGKPVEPLKWRLERSLWRDSSALFNLHRSLEARSDKTSINQLPPRILEYIAELPLESKERKIARYRCLALGLMSSNDRVDFYRREEMPLPLDYLWKPHLVNKLNQALDQTNKVSTVLTKSSDKLANYLLESKPNRDGDDIEKRRRAMRSWVEQHYWPNLTQPFYEFMGRLRDAADLDAQLVEWHEEIIRIALRALENVGTSLGDSAQAYKARVRAKQEFDKGIDRLKPKEKKQ